MILRKGNIVRAVKDDQVIICTISKFHIDRALIKHKGKKYYLDYLLIDAVVGHEHLVKNSK